MDNNLNTSNSTEYTVGLLEYWKKCLTRNNNSYKLVLALSILDHIKSEDKLQISYKSLIGRFMMFYWDQSVIYKLNHAANVEQVPVFVKLIRELNPPDIYFKKAKYSFAEEISEIEEYILNGYLRVLRNPVSRFQADYTVRNKAEGDKVGSGKLYSWFEDQGYLSFDKDSFSAIKIHLELFKDITVLSFVQFLERNNSIPKLYRKLGIEERRMPIKTALKNTILESSEFCFYCKTHLEYSSIHIDHFIPWSYVLEHDQFNLVPACQACNNGKDGKFAYLPDREFLEELQDRNLFLFGADELTYHKNSMLENQWRNAYSAGYSVWNKRFPS